jgi:hypothetical protein
MLMAPYTFSAAMKKSAGPPVGLWATKSATTNEPTAMTPFSHSSYATAFSTRRSAWVVSRRRSARPAR